jgi:hypothetical protein
MPQKKERLKKNLILLIKNMAINKEARLQRCSGRVERKSYLSGYKAG